MGTALLAAHMPFKFNDMIFGGQAGFNWQAGAWVAGIEADFQQSRQRGRAATLNCATAVCNPAVGAFGLDAPVTVTMAQKLEWFSTLRARLGLTPTPDSLLYATGGLAVGGIRTSGPITGSRLNDLQGTTGDVIPHGTIAHIDEHGHPIQIPLQVPL